MKSLELMSRFRHEDILDESYIAFLGRSNSKRNGEKSTVIKNNYITQQEYTTCDLQAKVGLQCLLHRPANKLKIEIYICSRMWNAHAISKNANFVYWRMMKNCCK